MSSARFLPTVEEVQERRERGLGMDQAKRVITREKLFAEVEVIRNRSAQGLPVEDRIADILDTLIARLT